MRADGDRYPALRPPVRCGESVAGKAPVIDGCETAGRHRFASLVFRRRSSGTAMTTGRAHSATACRGRAPRTARGGPMRESAACASPSVWRSAVPGGRATSHEEHKSRTSCKCLNAMSSPTPCADGGRDAGRSWPSGRGRRGLFARGTEKSATVPPSHPVCARRAGSVLLTGAQVLQPGSADRARDTGARVQGDGRASGPRMGGRAGGGCALYDPAITLTSVGCSSSAVAGSRPYALITYS